MGHFLNYDAVGKVKRDVVFLHVVFLVGAFLTVPLALLTEVLVGLPKGAGPVAILWFGSCFVGAGVCGVIGRKVAGRFAGSSGAFEVAGRQAVIRGVMLILFGLAACTLPFADQLGIRP